MFAITQILGGRSIRFGLGRGRGLARLRTRTSFDFGFRHRVPKMFQTLTLDDPEILSDGSCGAFAQDMDLRSGRKGVDGERLCALGRERDRVLDMLKSDFIAQAIPGHSRA